MGVDLYCSQSEENCSLKKGKPLIFFKTNCMATHNTRLVKSTSLQTKTPTSIKLKEKEAIFWDSIFL
jgi:hypothetical protein